MRRFITIGITKAGCVEILHDADKEKSEHIDEFRMHAMAKKKKEKPKFAEVQVIDLSRGVIKRKRFGNTTDGGKRTIARTKKKRTVARVAGKKKPAAKRAPRKKATPPKPASEPIATEKETGAAASADTATGATGPTG